METIAFELKGKTAFFKKPDVNSKIYFTYSHIHKIALMGLLGAMLGYGGYTQQKVSIDRNGKNITNQYPEFYKYLRDLDLAIVPHGDRGYFSKKIQVFNNSVGYASNEEGGNLIVREQWIENPHWTIYLFNNDKIETEIFDKLKRAIINHEVAYIPYLGKNDHVANIEKPRLCESVLKERVEIIDSLFYPEGIIYDDFADPPENETFYYFEEMMPYQLDPELNYYKFKSMGYTNKVIESINSDTIIYQAEDRTLALI
ncbi:type I-B CRISPR-associated protein Cas5 [Terrilactibacillus sp. BCM23-1]|uniref:Type I-B CRISPR-associated protein Cas5 n=1 Tax=Terrilactibacillus tamarindi TaxID=2599694 RepID=A0A6N8CTQ1_9BACI|nr:type I-B CRISPR-associated protein Cas5b [Terrilactibacillus tamarindi]MTT31376.1 type I-B CRISPR-associated protein Cas5 [Terrilactibacillus tamarindi]